VIDVVEIEAVKEVTLDLTAAFARLMPQLSSSSPPPSADELAEIIAHPGSTLFVAKLDDQIVGTLTLVIFRIPTGLRAWIEDVVVDEAAGGRGIGTALNRAALNHAAEVGARTVDLTSRPSREIANGMYKKIGFELRETNVYRYSGRSE
jgi:ribosomal protein S18 acetylase RimI-like enzyme